jgi:hypothetical protein
MNAKYVYHLQFHVKPELRRQFATCFAKVLEAHRRHEKGLGAKCACYHSYIGNGDVVRVFVPLQALGDMDLWVHTPQIVMEVFGPQDGLGILENWAAAMDSWESLLLERSDIPSS